MFKGLLPPFWGPKRAKMSQDGPWKRSRKAKITIIKGSTVDYGWEVPPAISRRSLASIVPQEGPSEMSPETDPTLRSSGTSKSLR